MQTPDQGERNVSLRTNEIKIAGHEPDKIKHPFRGTTTSADLAQAVGQIAITWGALEARLNALIPALGSPEGLPDNWKFRSFGSRRKLCKTLVRERFPVEEIRKEIAHALGEASTIQWKRNILVHGEVSTRLEVIDAGDPLKGVPGTIDAFILARGEIRGREVVLDLSTEQAKEVFYAIGHASGLLFHATDPSRDFASVPEPHRSAWLEVLAKLPPK